jgi:hypothetical protein
LEPFDGSARFGLVTVNFSTTHYLKLMLLTLVEQHELARLSRVIVVDNDSRDGGKRFCRNLADACPNIHLIEHRHWLNHGRGLRSGVAELERVEQGLLPSQRSNVLLVCDTDIIFRNPETLEGLAHLFETEGAVFAGELRRGLYPYPEAQASFFALRRDAYGRKDVRPFVHHGAPAYWTQRSLWQAGFTLTDFPSNRGGYILHRGRSAVAASRKYRPGNPHATAPGYHPHFMGILDGHSVWAAMETRYAELLTPEAEDKLLEILARHFHIQ